MRNLKYTVEIKRRWTEANAPVFVVKNGDGRFVAMYIECYEKIMGKIYESKLVNDGLSDIEEGKTVDGDTVKTRMAEKYIV